VYKKHSVEMNLVMTMCQLKLFILKWCQQCHKFWKWRQCPHTKPWRHVEVQFRTP
jgi:hypothetical protein